MKAEIAVGATGNAGTLVVDGRDISHFTRRLLLTTGVGEVTRLELELLPTKGAAVFADAEVSIGEETAALLVRLGWTPPDLASSTSPPRA